MTSQPMPSTEARGGLRWLSIGVGAVTILCGAVLLFATERTLTFVAVLAGISLCVIGLVDLVGAFARPVDRRLSWLRGGLSFAAGVALMVWPGISVGVLAALYGLFLVAVGAAELAFGLHRRPT